MVNNVVPHIKYIFIDESGDLGKHGSSYFTIVALSTHSPVALQRIVKRARQRILKKELKKLPEVKANNSNERIRKFVLRSLNACNCSISAVVISKEKIKDYLFDHKDKLYNYFCGVLFEHVDLNTDVLKIVIDKKHSNRLLREDFNKYIESKIRAKNNAIRVEITHLESHSSGELQVADFVAWAVNRKYVFGDASYYDGIKSKIKNQNNEEMWKE